MATPPTTTTKTTTKTTSAPKTAVFNGNTYAVDSKGIPTGKMISTTTAPAPATSPQQVSMAAFQKANPTAKVSSADFDPTTGAYKGTSTIAPTDMTGTTPKLDTYKPATLDAAGINAGAQSTLDSYAQYNIDSKKNQQDTQTSIDKLMASIITPEQNLQSSRQESGLDAAQKIANEENAKLQAVIKQGQANQLSVVGQGRGIPEAIIGGQQAQFARETAIQALPIQASLEAAQGNLAAATATFEKLFSAKQQDAQNKLSYGFKVIDTISQFASDRDKVKLDYVKLQEQRKYDASVKVKDQISSLTNEALKYGLTSSVGDKIASVDMTAPNAVQQVQSLVAPFILKSQNELIKNTDGSYSVVNKLTGQLISSGGGSSSNTNAVNTVIRSITLPDGNKKFVDSYKLIAGDDPYFIAKNNGTDIEGLKQLNPNIKDWNNIPVGAILNVPNTQYEKSILGATGLGPLAYAFATQGTNGLTRQPEKSRNEAMNEWQQYQIRNGIDGATFQSQYKAINSTIQSNVARNNQVAISENEILGTIDNLKSVANDSELKKLKYANVLKYIAGEQVNDPLAIKYATHLEQLRNEFAAYNAAAAGQLDSNGNIREISEADKKAADDVLKRGLNSGSLTGFESAINASKSKLDSTLKSTIDVTNKKVWDLFGVGGKYSSIKEQSSLPNSNELDNLWNNSTGDKVINNASSLLDNFLNN